MNQILSVENTTKKRRKTNIHSIVMVYVVILMIFGIGLTSTGAYALYKNKANSSDSKTGDVLGTKPVITIERENASTINIVVTHDKEISNMTYAINNEEPVEIDGEGENEISKEVELPVGETKITITAKDINGASSSYENTFEIEEKPIITLEQASGKIKATVTSNKNIDYIVYYWDDAKDQAKKFTINDVKTETFIDVLGGTHTLNIGAIDVEGNKVTKKQKVIGDNKPDVKITTDGQQFYITGSDDEELAKIEIKLNSNETQTEEINGKEYSTTVKLENGENKLTVTIYNKNGLSKTSRVKYTKE